VNKGIRVIICIIAVVLIEIAEKGIPVKFNKWDGIGYFITLMVFITISDCW